MPERGGARLGEAPARVELRINLVGKGRHLKRERLSRRKILGMALPLPATGTHVLSCSHEKARGNTGHKEALHSTLESRELAFSIEHSVRGAYEQAHNAY